jgi:hypothetical protein
MKILYLMCLRRRRKEGKEMEDEAGKSEHAQHFCQ